jgi:phage-related protein
MLNIHQQYVVLEKINNVESNMKLDCKRKTIPNQRKTLTNTITRETSITTGENEFSCADTRALSKARVR